jgi:hypothetical protein
MMIRTENSEVDAGAAAAAGRHLKGEADWRVRWIARRCRIGVELAAAVAIVVLDVGEQ